MTEGELAGARVRGIDQIRIRDDGSVVLDIRETIETDRGAISADVRGYAIPDPDAPHLHEIRGFALFDTAVPRIRGLQHGRRGHSRKHRRDYTRVRDQGHGGRRRAPRLRVNQSLRPPARRVASTLRRSVAFMASATAMRRSRSAA
jgi:hypothetical protein